MAIVQPTKQHALFYSDLIDLLRKHSENLSGAEMLALAAQTTGKILAMQDQRSMTPEQAMQMVMDNMMAGNHQAMVELGAPQGNA